MRVNGISELSIYALIVKGKDTHGVKQHKTLKEYLDNHAD